MTEAVDRKLLQYDNGTCLKFQHKDITEIESTLNENFSMIVTAGL